MHDSQLPGPLGRTLPRICTYENLVFFTFGGSIYGCFRKSLFGVQGLEFSGLRILGSMENLGKADC